jgi:hypothetical protein
MVLLPASRLGIFRVCKRRRIELGCKAWPAYPTARNRPLGNSST